MPTQTRKYRVFLTRLKEARVSAGLTQAEAGKLMKRDQTFISKCESGERRVDFIELLEFAQVYRKPLSFFAQNLDD
jgi:transcriptional regulator with XRE-family HTH domain